MALDGIFLDKIKDEISEKAIGMRVDKVQQPTRDEVIFVLRGNGTVCRLLCCVRADSPRLHFTCHTIDNPPAPPMFCMLMRKYLTGAVLKGVRQVGLDRILFLDFDATNEIGDKVELSLCIEIMAKYSNMILLCENKVIDSVKRVDMTTSSVRQILPGIEYKLPLSQNKLNIETTSVEEISNRIFSFEEKYLSSAIMNSIEGVSPIIAREISYRISFDDVIVSSLVDEQKKGLSDILTEIKNNLHCTDKVYMVCEENNKPKDFSFMNVRQYGNSMLVKEYDSCSSLLDDFYFERDRINRINHRGHELIKTLNNLIDRTARKLNIQREELKQCENKDTLKLYGELILTNQYNLSKGVNYYEVENYYDNYSLIKIPCNPALSPMENQKKYYKEYRKAQTAEKMLTKLYDDGEKELEYFESVLDELSRADTDSELSTIRLELFDGGYVKNTKGKKQKPPKELPPIEFMSTDGYRILVGRNNIQNDKLSLKTANKNDMWLHTQKIPGSHVIIEAKNAEVSDLSIEQAAVIAAYHSKAKDSSLVPVDYTKVKALKKPNGAKAGMVIYHEYFTIITNPDKELVEKLRVK